MPVEGPGLSDVMGDVLPTASFTTSSTATEAVPAASAPDAEAGSPVAARPQAYAMGLAAAAFLVGVALITRGRFYP